MTALGMKNILVFEVDLQSVQKAWAQLSAKDASTKMRRIIESKGGPSCRVSVKTRKINDDG